MHPLLGEVFAVGEFIMSIVIVSAALFGSETIISNRAFRLLRWMANRPEPLALAPAQPVGPSPEGVQPAGLAQYLIPAPHAVS